MDLPVIYHTYLLKFFMKNIFSFFALILFLFACNNKPEPKTYFTDAFSYCKTVKQLNEVVKFVGFSPIVASRNYAYANIAAYECIAAGYPKEYISLSGQLNGFTMDLSSIKKDTKIDYEFASLLSFCKVGESVTFPEGSMHEFVDSVKKVANDAGMSSDMFNNSLAFADSVSNQVLAWSKKDNYAQTRSSSRYTVSDVPGRWVPTPPAYASAMEPHWNEIRTMVMDSANQFAPPPPIPYNMTDKSGPYYKQVMAVKNGVDSLSPEQSHIAEFWDDLGGKMNVVGHVMFVTKKFSPPGHWMNIVGIAAKEAKASFRKTVAAYALTGICMFDAFIQCWDSKFHYNMIRPETVINKFIDQDWRPYLQTPPFPEYSCGHCTISAASAEALTKMFGDNMSYKDTSELEFGIANRSFPSFRKAAEENVLARFYGGIHFMPSNKVAHEGGIRVGNYIIDRLKMQK